MTRATDVTADTRPALVPTVRFPAFRDAPAWESKILGEEGELLPSLNGKSAQHFGVGGAKYVTYMNVFSNAFTDMSSLGIVDVEASESQTAIRVGDLLLTISSETPDEAGMSSVVLDEVQDCYLNSFCAIFRFADEKQPNLHFLGYLMRQPLVRAWLAERAQGSTRFNLSKAAFRSVPIALPTADEQQKIGECLNTLDELIGAESQKLDALKIHKKGLMQQLFPREGEVVPRFRFPEFQDTPEWDEAILGDLFDPIRNGFVGTATPHYVSDGGVRYLQGRNIKRGKIEADNVVHISQEFHRRQKKSYLQRGDLLMVQSGHVGECAVVTDTFVGSNCHALIILSPRRTLISEFFVNYFYSPIGESAIFQITTGNTIKHILASELKALKVLLPSLAEQRQIALCLSSLDELIVTERDKLEALNFHKQGLMQQIFPSPPAAEA